MFIWACWCVLRETIVLKIIFEKNKMETNGSHTRLRTKTDQPGMIKEIHTNHSLI